MTEELSISEFVKQQKEWLSLELQADQDSTCAASSSGDSRDQTEERTSHILGNLQAAEVFVGLYGRTVVQFTTLAVSSSRLPAHRITVGDEVEIRSSAARNRKEFPGGVVNEVAETNISVALFAKKNQKIAKKEKDKNQDDDNNDDDDDEDELGAPPFTLVPRSSAEVHKKLIHALDTLNHHGPNHPIAGAVIQAVFTRQDFSNIKAPSSFYPPFNDRLDQSQQHAIAFALQQNRPFALIHGPPGTGKTTTVVELIQQAVYSQKLKVLVAAPSNVAIDNVLERLVKDAKPKASTKKNANLPQLRAVRLGHPARLKSSILPYSLEALVQNADGTEIVADVRKELQAYLKLLANPKSKPSDKRIAYRELKSLRQEIRKREEKVVQELMASAQVVLATNVGAANRVLKNCAPEGFDLVIIDEAAQALEASCWIPILRGKRVVLAGDHCQLPPTVKSHQAQAAGLGCTLFERLMAFYGDDNIQQRHPQISCMLSVQYRMHELIANWASRAMYHGNLSTHDSVRKRTLSQLEGFRLGKTHNEHDSISNTPLLLIDTAGCEMHELVNAAGSKYNPEEAMVVAHHVKKLMEAGMSPSQLCVITPYNGQVECLRNLLLHDYPKLEIRSVDGFQGGERDAVILSLVRSSERSGKNGIGFLKDDRRQNVAVTRAKRHLALVGDSETVSQSKFIASLVSWIEEHGEQRSAIEYQHFSTLDGPDEGDLRAAEEKIMKLVELSVPSRKEEPKAKPAPTANPQMPKETPRMGFEARKGLMDNIAEFAAKSQPDEELKLSPSLTSYDRRLVHEFADQLGLGHRSEGEVGQGRRIILTKKYGGIKEPFLSSEEPSPQEVGLANIDGNEAAPIGSDDTAKGSRAISFSALAIHNSSDSENENDDVSFDTSFGPRKQPSGNGLLASMAKEREQRQERKGATEARGPSGTGKKNNKKGKGKKLGGKKQDEEDPKLDDLDDMAFLDAQIERAQSAHGRKVAGPGKGYKTIVNGILNARPEPRSAPKNAQAASSLKSKLRDAQNDRKGKGPKNKGKN